MPALAALAIEIVLLLGLAVAQFLEMWGVEISSRRFDLPAEQYEVQHDHGLAVTALTICSVALLMVSVIGLCYIRKPGMVAVQILLFIAVAVITSSDATWAWHVLHPVQPAPYSWTPNTPTNGPCMSGSNTCN